MSVRLLDAQNISKIITDDLGGYGIFGVEFLCSRK